MGKVAAIFPGQGSQFEGMARELVDSFSWVKALYEEASDSIKTDLLKLCRDGLESDLKKTENAQPCILTTSFAWYQALRKEYDFRPDAASGHSLGEYTALLAAGTLSLSEAVSVVRKRGQLMQSAVPLGKGKMAAIIGLSEEKTVALCEKVSEGEGSLAVPANFNSPVQIVIAGHAEAIDRAEKLATDKTSEFKAKRFVPLAVSAPFHSPLMKPVVEGLAPNLEEIAWQDFQFPVAFNVDGKLSNDKSGIVGQLKLQIDHPVRWTQCVQTLFDSEHQTFVEPGPGKVLSGLVKRIVREAHTKSVDSIEQLKQFGTK